MKRGGRMLGRYFLFVMILGAFAGEAAWGQAWPQERGRAYLKLSYGQALAAEQYDAEGAVRPYAPGIDGDAFRDRSLYLYAEYGLTDALTVVALVPYKRITVKGDGFENDVAALGSVIVGVRTSLKRFFGMESGAHSLALNTSLVLPAGYTRNTSPAAGPGQVDLQAMLNYGVSFYPFPGYAQAGFGYRYRSTLYAFSAAMPCHDDAPGCLPDTRPAYDDELLMNAEVGFSLDRYALIQLLAQGVWSNQLPETSFDPRNPIPTRQRYVKTGAGLTVYPLPALGLSALVLVTPSGRNTIRSTDLFFGLEYRL